MQNRVENRLLEQQLNEMVRLATPVDTSGNEVNEPKPHYIRSANIKADYSKTELKTEEDVDEYVEVLRKTLKEHIKNHRRISL